MISTNEFTEIRNLYLEFSTNYRDGKEYNTHNSDQLPGFPPVPHKRTERFPHIKDPRNLYEVHKAILKADGRDRQSKLLKFVEQFGGDPIADLLDGMREESDLAANAGYFRLSPDGKHHCLTFIGAFLMSWKELWPLKAIRRMNRDRRAQAILRDLGFDS